MIEPTDRSMPAVRMTPVIPVAIRPVIETSQHVEQIAIGQEDVAPLEVTGELNIPSQEDQCEAPIGFVREGPEDPHADLGASVRGVSGAASRMMVSSLAVRLSTPRGHPSDTTRMRSASSSNSGSSELTEHDGQAAAGKSEDRLA